MPRRAVLLATVILAGWLPASPSCPGNAVDVTTPPAQPKYDAATELAKPFHETGAKRFENVFFIALPFTALYASLATSAVGFAIEGRRFRLSDKVVAVDLTAAVALAVWIAARDTRDHSSMPAPTAAQSPPPSATPSLEASPALSATTAAPSSTLLR